MSRPKLLIRLAVELTLHIPATVMICQRFRNGSIFDAQIIQAALVIHHKANAEVLAQIILSEPEEGTNQPDNSVGNAVTRQ
ncbi:hypothetical protein AL065_18815 [Pseudomonas amygdali pv. ulmi]|uniref:hypothetical protein n=1 Tax=Pseudomonas amygdali TaxID=47877 RepID=UPI00070F0051|nr:hypothetical protein [Pseudomonas amygdali]KWS27502.1 hypothetical protein AL065_18815 [Pseudomonas amygdali pv. ulmi]